MSGIPRLRNYDGPTLLSYGFRPFFLFGAVYAGLTVLAWLPMFNGELVLWSAFSPVDWHAHEMLYGYLPAVVTGFLLTAIPNWTGRLPIQGMPLLALVAVWVAGRVCVTYSAETGWLVAAIVDVGFLALVVAAAAREIVTGKNWRNLRVVGLVTLLLAGNIAFHLEAHIQGTAEYGARIGIAAIVLLIVLIGGRIVPSFTRNWLARENPGRLPAPIGRFDVVTIGITAATLALWTVQPIGRPTAVALAASALLNVIRLGRWAGDRTCRDRLVLILHVGYAFVPIGFSARRRGRFRCRCRKCRDPCLDGRGGGDHDACGHDPRQPWAYRPCAHGLGGDPGDLCGHRHCRIRADRRVAATGIERSVAACHGHCLVSGIFCFCRVVRAHADQCTAACTCGRVTRRCRDCLKNAGSGCFGFLLYSGFLTEGLSLAPGLLLGASRVGAELLKLGQEQTLCEQIPGACQIPIDDGTDCVETLNFVAVYSA